MDHPISKLISYENEIPNDPSRLIMEGNLGPILTKWTPTTPLQFLGIEIEVERCIEKIQKIQKIICPYYAHLDQDGSLRNGGIEIITKPIRAAVLETLLENIYKNLPEGYDFSPRTSIHVHINIRDLTQKQLLGVIYTYIVVEKLLYNWVGHNRDKSIFCVPLHTTTLPLNLEKILTSRSMKLIQWFKYTGLNLLPIRDLGTIEFRHLYGTDNIQTILTWVGLIQQLFNFTIKNSYEDLTQRLLNLNSSSEYQIFLEDIFQDKTPIIHYSNFEKDIKFGISYLKNYVFENTFQNELRHNFSTTSTLYKRLQENLTEQSKQRTLEDFLGQPREERAAPRHIPPPRPRQPIDPRIWQTDAQADLHVWTGTTINTNTPQVTTFHTGNGTTVRGI